MKYITQPERITEINVTPEKVVSPLLKFSINPGSGKTKIKLTIVAITSEVPVIVTVSVKICVKPTSKYEIQDFLSFQ